MHRPISLTAFLTEPRTPRGLFGYQVGSFDADKAWIPLVIVSSKFMTPEDASIHAQRQIEITEKALLKKSMRGTLNFKKPDHRHDGGGPSAA